MGFFSPSSSSQLVQVGSFTECEKNIYQKKAQETKVLARVTDRKSVNVAHYSEHKYDVAPFFKMKTLEAFRSLSVAVKARLGVVKERRCPV